MLLCTFHQKLESTSIFSLVSLSTLDYCCFEQCRCYINANYFSCFYSWQLMEDGPSEAFTRALGGNVPNLFYEVVGESQG